MNGSRKGRLGDVIVERSGGVFALAGDLANAGARAAVEPAGGIVGFGLAGHLAAAFLSAFAGADGGFLRLQPKVHGTGRRLDGAVPRGAVRAIVTAEDERDACHRALVEEGLDHLAIVTVPVRPVNVVPTSLVVGLTLRPPPAPVAPADVVELLRGSFTLSSGASSRVYWETLPAAHVFGVAWVVAESVREGTIPVGVGHGGAYLGVVAALRAGAGPIVVDPSQPPASPILDVAPTLLDDFVTTGGAFEAALRAFDGPAQEAAALISLYARADRVAVLGHVAVLEVLP